MSISSNDNSYYIMYTDNTTGGEDLSFEQSVHDADSTINMYQEYCYYNHKGEY